jgi:hypothetical protein
VGQDVGPAGLTLAEPPRLQAIAPPVWVPERGNGPSGESRISPNPYTLPNRAPRRARAESSSRVGGGYSLPPHCPRKLAQTLALPQATGQIPTISSRFWRPKPANLHLSTSGRRSPWPSCSLWVAVEGPKRSFVPRAVGSIEGHRRRLPLPSFCGPALLASTTRKVGGLTDGG